MIAFLIIGFIVGAASGLTMRNEATVIEAEVSDERL